MCESRRDSHYPHLLRLVVHTLFVWHPAGASHAETATTPNAALVSVAARPTLCTLLPGHPLTKAWALKVDTSEDDAPDDDDIPDVEADPYGIGPIWDKYKPMRIGRRRVACALDDLKPTNFAIVRAAEDAEDDG